MRYQCLHCGRFLDNKEDEAVIEHGSYVQTETKDGHQRMNKTKCCGPIVEIDWTKCKNPLDTIGQGEKVP